jgi:N-ethylmaleimide reductase
MGTLLFSPVTLGDLTLRNRVVMAPMTRDRAGPGDVPTPLMVEYYRQRAGAGLIITEGAQPSAEGKGYWRTPGTHSDAQEAGWRQVADAVHAEGGLVAIQLMHCGRVVVPANRGFDADVVAPSALACPVPVPGPDGVPAPCATPRALAAEELPALAAQFAEAARRARAAGIDAVELHCASGYLINQFLNPASNRRDDRFGGSAEGRARFPAMVVRALVEAIGGGRVGIRISPGNPYNGMDPADPAAIFAPFLQAIDGLGLAWLHVVDMGLPDLDTLAFLRRHWAGPIITNNNLKQDSAEAALAAGRAEAVSFGRAFIANPDLVARMQAGAPLARPDFGLLYTGEERGYTDYPALGSLG